MSSEEVRYWSPPPDEVLEVGMYWSQPVHCSSDCVAGDGTAFHGHRMWKSEAEFNATDRVRIREGCLQANDDAQNNDGFLREISSHVEAISSMYVTYGRTRLDLKSFFQNLWYHLFYIARTTPALNTFAMQQLVRTLDTIRMRGEPWPVRQDNGTGTVVHTADRLWSELPFFAASLDEAWKEVATLSTGNILQWRSLSTFTALLTQDGGLDCIAYLALLFHTALEVERPLSPDDASGDVHSKLSSIEELLPLIIDWFKLCPELTLGIGKDEYPKLNTVADAMYPPMKLDPILEKNEASDRVFSIAKWQLWRSRLLDIRQSSTSPSREVLQEASSALLQRMPIL